MMWIKTSDDELINTQHVFAIRVEEIPPNSVRFPYEARIVASTGMVFDEFNVEYTLYKGTQKECIRKLDEIERALSVSYYVGDDGTEREPQPEPEKRYFNFDPDEVPF